MTRSTILRPMLLAAAVFTAAGGYIHLREWLNTYRHLPASAPGAWVVRLGFPVNAAASLVLAVALVLAATKLPRLGVAAFMATVGFQASSLGVLIATRTGSVFGWTEPIWTPGANQSRAVEIGALFTLGVLGALFVATRPTAMAPASHLSPAPAAAAA